MGMLPPVKIMFGFGYSSLTMNLKIDILKERELIVAAILLALVPPICS